MWNHPLSKCNALVAAGTNFGIAFPGDSVTYAAGDALAGFGRIVAALATHYNCNANRRMFDILSETYSAPDFTLRSGGASPVMITFLNGGWPGINVATLDTYTPGVVGAAPIGLVHVGIGFNGGTISEFLTFLGHIRAATDAPILVTTQNAVSPAQLGYSNIVSLFNQVVAALIPGETRPMSPVLKESTTLDDVWVMDTERFTAPYGSTYNVDGLHLNAAGYTKQSADEVSTLLSTLVIAPVITTTTLLPLGRGEPFTQTLIVDGDLTGGVTWAVTSGKLPTGLTLGAATGVLSGTPVSYSPTYNFTVSATTAAGVDEQQYTGSIDINASPFNPTGRARFKVKRANAYLTEITNWYDIPLKVNVAVGGDPPEVIAAATIPATLPFTLPSIGVWLRAVMRR